MALDSIYRHINSLPDKRVVRALTNVFKRFTPDSKDGLTSLRVTGRLFQFQGAPETATGTASLTDAQMLSGILVATPAAAAAYTVRTGAQLEAAVRAKNPDLVAGDSFDLTIINLGATTFDITMTAAAGITFVGEVVLRPGADAATEQGGQGTWRFRFTATSTFIAYRVA